MAYELDGTFYGCPGCGCDQCECAAQAAACAAEALGDVHADNGRYLGHVELNDNGYWYAFDADGSTLGRERTKDDAVAIVAQAGG